MLKHTLLSTVITKKLNDSQSLATTVYYPRCQKFAAHLVHPDVIQFFIQGKPRGKMPSQTGLAAIHRY